MLTNPIREREVLPTFDLIRFLDAAASGIDGAAEADADGLDVSRATPACLRSGGNAVSICLRMPAAWRWRST